MKDKVNVYLHLIFAFLGFDFFKSGWEKVSGGEFVGTLATTLGKFAAKNPNPLAKDFLNNVAIPNATIFGYLTMWGELLAGLNILVLSVYLIFASKPNRFIYGLIAVGFFVGLFLNTNFYFAAGWTSVSTAGLNLTMGFVNLIGLIYSLRKLMQR